MSLNKAALLHHSLNRSSTVDPRDKLLLFCYEKSRSSGRSETTKRCSNVSSSPSTKATSRREGCERGNSSEIDM